MEKHQVSSLELINYNINKLYIELYLSYNTWFNIHILLFPFQIISSISLLSAPLWISLTCCKINSNSVKIYWSVEDTWIPTSWKWDGWSNESSIFFLHLYEFVPTERLEVELNIEGNYCLGLFDYSVLHRENIFLRILLIKIIQGNS